MKRTTVAAASLLLLTGCAAPVAAPAPTVTATVTATPTPEPTPEPEPTLDFVDWMDHQAPEWRDMGSVADLRELAEIVCDSLDIGVTVGEVADLIAPELGPDVAGAVVVGAIGIECDWHEDALNDYVDAL